MDPSLARVGLNLAAALVAGAVIGAERSYNGRTAGFRTNALVALAAAGAMTISLQPAFAPHAAGQGAASLDPTRLGQGVMTGIGFLGAGVIFKEGISIQGLTTAAGIWAVAAIGMLFGLGMHGPGVLMTVMVLAVLMGLRVLETRLPRMSYALATFVFDAPHAPDEEALRTLLGVHEVRLYDVSYAKLEGGKLFEYSANLSTSNEDGLRRLAGRLKQTAGLVEFRLARLSR
ncbi:MAG TPA: MgtC/SapB family protein [Caulobacteraceae bacterium]|nr:MgtC/SapB family protein [Caulobacteraceae bacterium]